MERQAYVDMARQEDHHWWFEGRRQIVRSLLKKHLRTCDGRRILDVGCGTGGMFPMLSELGQTEGADGSPDAIRFATERFPGLVVHEARMPEMMPAGTWDVITAFDVVEHLDQPVESLSALRDHLTPTGQVVVTVPAYAFLWSHHDEVHHHKRRYTQSLLRAHLAAAGLVPTYMTHFNTWLLPAIAGVRLAQHLLPKRNATESAGDLKQASGPLNSLLTRLFASEAAIMRHVPLPVGVSIFAIADRA